MLCNFCQRESPKSTAQGRKSGWGRVSLKHSNRVFARNHCPRHKYDALCYVEGVLLTAFEDLERGRKNAEILKAGEEARSS